MRRDNGAATVSAIDYLPSKRPKFSQLYSADDPHLMTGVQFGVTKALIGHYVRHEAVAEPW